MSLIGTSLAVASALAFAGFDVTRKRVSPLVHPLALTVWLQIASAPFFGAWILTAGAQWTEPWLVPGLSAIALQAAANGLFLTALSIAPLSRTVPFLSLTPVLSAAAAWALLGETPSGTALIGMGLVTLGAFGLALERTGEGFRVEKGSLLTIGVAALWSAGGAVDKAALQHATPSAHAALVTMGVLLVFALERSVRGGPGALRLPRPARGRLLLAALFGSAALGLQLSAFEHALVSIVETVKRAVGGAASLVFGRLVFGETIGPRAVLSVLLMSAGTALVLLEH